MEKRKPRKKLVYDKRDAAALALNICLVVWEIKAMIIRTTRYGSFGAEYYTQDSNLFMLIVAAIACYFLLRKIIKQKEFPRWFSLLKYAVTLALLVTFLVVVCILAPGMNPPFGYYVLLFSGPMYYTHLICPLVAMLCFCVLEKHDLSNRLDPLWALSYTLLYAFVLTLLNILTVVKGPYPFLMVYEQPIWATILWMIGILGGAYLIALLLRKMRLRK